MYKLFIILTMVLMVVFYIQVFAQERNVGGHGLIDKNKIPDNTGGGLYDEIRLAEQLRKKKYIMSLFLMVRQQNI